MLKTTAVRLTLVYTLLFGLLAIGVVAYVSYNTGRIILSQVEIAVDEEVDELTQIFRRGGVRRLFPAVERRSRAPGANLYLIADASGRVIAGNVRDMDRSLLSADGWRYRPFIYEPFEDDDEVHRAMARVFPLPGGLRLLVGRDIGEANQFRDIVGRASTLALVVMVLTGLLLWFFVGRRALKRVDSVSRSSARIIGGDLSERLPISGSGDEFDRLSRNLNRIIARVEKLNSGMRDMSDSIAHDLKTPLTRLRNKAEAALVSNGSKNKREEILQSIIDDSDGLIRTFDALLMISQVETGARAAHLEPLQLKSVVSDVHELFAPSAEDSGVQLELELREAVTVNGNRELLAQAMTNLLDNALKYGVTEAASRIVLKVKKEGGKAVIEVSDNGPGIPPDQRGEVRERFVRLDTSRSKPGSGLGLALVDAVAGLHGGSLELLDNNPGLVARLVIPLP